MSLASNNRVVSTDGLGAAIAHPDDRPSSLQLVVSRRQSDIIRSLQTAVGLQVAISRAPGVDAVLEKVIAIGVRRFAAELEPVEREQFALAHLAGVEP